MFHIFLLMENSWKQRVVLNGSRCPSSFCSRPLSIFSFHINDSSKFFVDDTSIFSVAHDPVKSVNAINKALSIITRRAFKFNPDWSKQAQEVIFARKTSTINYAALINYALINLLSTLFMAKKQHHKSIFGMTQIKLHGHLLQKKKKT